VVRQQSRKSSSFEALLKLGGVRSLLLIKMPCQDCATFNIQYQYQYGLILILNIDGSPAHRHNYADRLGNNYVKQAVDRKTLLETTIESLD